MQPRSWTKGLIVTVFSFALGVQAFSEVEDVSQGLEKPGVLSVEAFLGDKPSQTVDTAQNELIFREPVDEPKPVKGFDCSAVRSGFEVSARAAAFIPIFENVRKAYGDMGDYQLEFSQNFGKLWSLWAGAQYIYGTGHSNSSCKGCIRAKTKLHLWPLSFGLKYNFYFGSCTDIYLGAGVVYSFLRIHDHWPYVIQHISKGGVGGLFKLGAKHYFTRLFFIEVFADYLLQRFHFHNPHSGPFVQRHNLYLDGVLLGGGLGFNF